MALYKALENKLELCGSNEDMCVGFFISSISINFFRHAPVRREEDLLLPASSQAYSDKFRGKAP
jgi:hypothetical protein